MRNIVNKGSPKKLLKYLKQAFFNTESKKRSSNLKESISHYQRAKSLKFNS